MPTSYNSLTHALLLPHYNNHPKSAGDVVTIKKSKESDDDEVLRKTTLREVTLLRLL